MMQTDIVAQIYVWGGKRSDNMSPREYVASSSESGVQSSSKAARMASLSFSVRNRDGTGVRGRMKKDRSPNATVNDPSQ
jgi:hypothetical protein